MNVSTVNYWIKIAMLVQLKISLEIKFEVLENQLDLTIVWKEPEVDILLGINFPMLDCWEFDGHEGLVE